MRILLLLLFCASALADTIAVNNAAVVSGLSKDNWVKSGSSYILTPNPGAYLKLNFTGTSFGVTVDVSAMSGASYASGIYPVIRTTVDGISADHQLASSDTSLTVATGLADATHTFRLDLIGVDESGASNRWDGTMSLKITAFTVGSGKTVAAATMLGNGQLLCLGDSISEGAVTLANATNPPTYAQVEDATVGYQAILAAWLGMEYTSASFAGESWSGGVSSVPGLPSSYNFIISGVARTFSPAPTLVLVNMGTNGTVTAGTVTTWLGNLRSAVGASSFIKFIIPFGQFNVSSLTTGFNDYVSANPTDKRVALIDLGSPGSSIVSAHSYDTVHPNTLGQALLAEALKPLILYPLTAGNSPGVQFTAP